MHYDLCNVMVVKGICSLNFSTNDVDSEPGYIVYSLLLIKEVCVLCKIEAGRMTGEFSHY